MNNTQRQVAESLRQHGYSVKKLTGGLLVWRSDGQPIVAIQVLRDGNAQGFAKRYNRADDMVLVQLLEA